MRRASLHFGWLRRLALQQHALRWRSRTTIATAVCLASASAALLAPASAAASSQTMFTLVGRGWGHGIGMSQYGAEGYAINQPTWTYWNIIAHYYTGVTKGKVSNKTIRVLLQSGISNAIIAATGGYTITPSTGATSAPLATVSGGANATVTWSSSANTYQVVSGAQKWSFTSAPIFTPVGSATLLEVLTPDDNGHTGRYRGTVSIVHSSSGLSIVNSLPLESYLQGVVPREMPASWKPAALQAQAVAARAYAYRAIGGQGTFDVYCDTRSQVYGGYDAETPATNAAVSSTAGVVPLSGGSVIQAFFFSTSGGYTENNENVWGGTPLPYLRGVPDPYDTISPYHLWPGNPIIRSATMVAGQLATYDSDLSSATLGSLTTIAILQHGVSPRIVKALVVGSSGTAIVSGTDLRVALNLRDTWVNITSMSLAPAVADKTTISAGGAATLSGEIYPALVAGAMVTLHYYRGGIWQTTSVPTTRVTRTYGGYSISSSHYTCTVKPPATTYYYFSSGSAQSPQTVISVTSAVTPAVTLATTSTSVTAGGSLTLSGTVKPPVLGNTTVWLQTRSGATWHDAASTSLSSTGTFSLHWVAVAGINALRMRTTASPGFVTAYSPIVPVTIRSMSLSPPAAARTTIAYGGAATLSGEIYPALAAGATVTLHYYRDGMWRTTTAVTSRVARSDGGITIYTSRYTYKVLPPKTTEYYFSWGILQSPHTVIYVRPAITLIASSIRASAGTRLVLSGTVKPTLTGRLVVLEARSGTTWRTIASIRLGSPSTFRLTWSATRGVSALRAYMTAGSGLVAGYSTTVAIAIS